MITEFIKQKQDSLLNIVRENVRLTIVITWEDDSIITIYEKDKNTFAFNSFHAIFVRQLFRCK